VSGVQRGFEQDGTLTDDPDSLRHLIYQYRVDPGTDSIFVLTYMTNGPEGQLANSSFRVWSGFTIFGASDPPLGRPFVQDAYLSPRPRIDVPGLYTNTFKAAYRHHRPFVASINDRLLETPFTVLHSRDDARGYFTTFEGGVQVSRLTGDQVNVGWGPPTWFGRFDNAADQMLIRQAVGGRAGFYFLTQQSNWSPHPDLPYRLERDGAPVDSGTFHGSGVAIGINVMKTLVPGAHTLQVTNSLYRIAGRDGVARVLASFDTRGPDPNPPFLKSVTVLANGVVTDSMVVLPYQERELRFELADDHGLASAQAFFRVDGGPDWFSLSPTPEGSELVAWLPDTLGYLDLRIVGDDTSGNRLDYTMEPGVYLAAGTVGVEPDGSPSRAVLALRGAIPNPAARSLTVSFSLPDTRPASLELFDLSGRSLRSRAVGSLGPGWHTVALDPERTLKPGLYLMRLRQGDRTLVAKTCVLR
jgi:hypothetical protein